MLRPGAFLLVVTACSRTQTPARSPVANTPLSAPSIGRYTCTVAHPGMDYESCCDVRVDGETLLLAETDGQDPLRQTEITLVGDIRTPEITEGRKPVRAEFRRHGNGYVAELEGYTLTLAAPCTMGGAR